MPGVNVPTQEEFDKLVQEFDELALAVVAVDARLTIVEANAKTMPDNIKAALKTVLEWMDANV